jgi:hypothetical protein
MHPPHRRALPPVLVAALLAAVAALGSPAVVGAYPSPGATATLHADCHAVFERSNPDCRLHFRLRDAKGRPVDGASVAWSVSGITGASVVPSGSVTGRGGQAGALFVPGAGNCEKTATITATAQGVTAQTQVEVECLSDRRGPHLPPPGLFRRFLSSLLVADDGAHLTWTHGGGAVVVTVPAGALPPGTQVSVVGADPSSIGALLHPGDVLIDSFAVEWTGAQPASAPISVAVHDAAGRSGLRVFEVTSAGLQPVPDASVSNGVTTVSMTEDPGFVVVSPATAAPGTVTNLSSGAATVVASGSSRRLALAVSGVVLVLVLAAWAGVRRRRQRGAA